MKKFIQWCKNWLEKENAEREKFNKERIVEKAKETFQICEHNKSVWLTYDGKLVCPVALFAETDPVAIVSVLRELYIENNTNE